MRRLGICFLILVCVLGLLTGCNGVVPQPPTPDLDFSWEDWIGDWYDTNPELTGHAMPKICIEEEGDFVSIIPFTRDPYGAQYPIGSACDSIEKLVKKDELFTEVDLRWDCPQGGWVKIKLILLEKNYLKMEMKLENWPGRQYDVFYHKL